MKRLVRWGLLVAGGLALLVAGGAAFLRLARPKMRPASNQSVERTPARLQRGTYLVEHLMPCMGCHSEHDVERYGMPITPDGMLSGGLLIDRSFGLPGAVQPPNITPDRETGIGDWSDGEVIRSIREGVDRAGKPLFPMMPYYAFRAMSDEDTAAVVVYLRALAPVRRATRPVEVDFPVSLFIRSVPEPVEGPVAAPGPEDHLAYGAYLVRLAACHECHTPMERGKSDESQAFAGGRAFAIPTSTGRFRVVTANLTPDPTGYFGRTTREEWIGRVRSFAALRADPPKVAHGRNTLMPWLEYAGLTDDDLTAIYDFMKTVRPVHKEVNSFPDAPPS